MQTKRLVVLVTFLFAAGCGVNDRAVDDRTPSKGDGASSAQTCGTIAGLTCPTGYTCVDDDPNDGCDYGEGGGADCSGVCQEDKPTPPPSPEGQTCGGFAGLQCPDGYTCVDDDPNDGCDYDGEGGGADCSGVCQADQPTPPPSPEGQTCGGFAGLQCPDGYTCVDDDPNDGCDYDGEGGGADCSGVCQKDQPVPPPTGGVIVTTDKSTYAAGEEGQATIDNQTAAEIFLAGCTQSSREQLVGGQWVDMGQYISCFWEGLAVPVAAGGSFTTAEGVRFDSPGTWRVRVDYGVGCQPNQPLSTAGCAAMHTAHSAPVTVLAP